MLACKDTHTHMKRKLAPIRPWFFIPILDLDLDDLDDHDNDTAPPLLMVSHTDSIDVYV